jgi:hypothetical protein
MVINASTILATGRDGGRDSSHSVSRILGKPSDLMTRERVSLSLSHSAILTSEQRTPTRLQIASRPPTVVTRRCSPDARYKMFTEYLKKRLQDLLGLLTRDGLALMKQVEPPK